MEVLREKSGWYLVRMEDGYLGWVDGAGLRVMEPAARQAYQTGSQVLITAKLADVFRPGQDPASPPSAGVITRVVMGTVLPSPSQIEETGHAPAYFEVVLPTGESGYVKAADARLVPSVVAVFAEQKSPQDVIALAGKFTGLAYLWGGTTSLGFDCSGFVQFVFGMNGYKLPRDADMQYSVGTAVASRADLRPGDLVFFSTYKAGPSHVGIYIGGSRYIHSSSAGVGINSFDPRARDYSERLDKAYLGARRIIEAGRP